MQWCSTQLKGRIIKQIISTWISEKSRFRAGHWPYTDNYLPCDGDLSHVASLVVYIKRSVGGFFFSHTRIKNCGEDRRSSLMGSFSHFIHMVRWPSTLLYYWSMNGHVGEGILPQAGGQLMVFLSRSAPTHGNESSGDIVIAGLFS